MNIREATTQEKEPWDTFVEREGGSFFHYFDWKTIYEARHWRYIPLLVENETNDIIAILPLVKIRFFLFSKLVSLPDGASGGVVFKQSLTNREMQQAMQMLITYVDETYAQGCSTFCLKENLSVEDASRKQPTEMLLQNGFRFRFDADLLLPCTYRLPLTPLFDNDIWDGLWGKYLRNHIRKSQKQGVIIREDKEGQYRDDVIAMTLSIYKRFDETPPSKDEMTRRLTTFNGKTKVWVALQNDTPIAALVCYDYHSVLRYASKLGYQTSARENYTTVFLLSEAIRDACRQGYQFFEFGVTETTTLARWKEQFKPIKIPLRIYEKNYSALRNFFEKTPYLIKWMMNNHRYLWENRRRLFLRIIRGKLLN